MSSIKIKNQSRQKLKDEITEIMINQARMKKPIYYGELSKKIKSFNLSPDDQILHDILGEISIESVTVKKGMLSVFAVRKYTDMPGSGFFSLAKKLGFRINTRKQFFEEQTDLVHNQYRDPTILTFE